MTDSYTTPTSYVGPDATALFQVKCLISGISVYAKYGIIPTRGMTITKMFKLAKHYTGQTYKRGEYQRAINDLTVWANTMRAALPHITE